MTINEHFRHAERVSNEDNVQSWHLLSITLLTKQNGSEAFIAGNMSSIYVLSHRVLVVYKFYCSTTPLLDNASTMLLVLLP